MSKDTKPEDLERRMAELEQYINSHGISGTIPRQYNNPLAEAIRQRKEMEARRRKMDETNEEPYNPLAIPRLVMPKKQKNHSILPVVGGVIIGIGLVAVAVLYDMGIIKFPYNFIREEPPTPRSHASAPANPAEQSDIEMVLGNVRAEIRRQNAPTLEGYLNSTIEGGDDAEKYFRAGSVMFSLGEVREGQDRIRNYETAVQYLEEAVRRKQQSNYENLLERARAKLREHNFLERVREGRN